VGRRLDIQGLRALAVLAVVAYHAGLPVPGGFVGVDVFFVVSGYVIADLLRREWQATGRIRFRAFYVRRFKRLTPALAAMVVAVAIGSALVLSPLGAQQTVSETGLGAMFLVANWVIAGNTGGYFDAPAAGNPLLHTWTLSVEEQFYLVFPALLALGFLLARRRRHAPTALVGAVAALSFTLVLVHAGGFYSPFARAWEFAVGALLALGGVSLRSRGVSLAGAGLLAASLWAIDSHTPFPSAWTLLPVGATALLIAGAPRVLAARPLVAIGDRSYSIYLWHWPCIVFATVLWADRPHVRAAAAAASLAPALASYRFVEQPLRALRSVPPRRLALLVACALVVPTAVAASLGSIATRYWTPRYESGAMPVANRGELGQGAWFRLERASSIPCLPTAIRRRALEWDGVLRCRQSKPGPAELALIGDSHAEHLFLGFADVLPRENVVYYTVDAAPTLADPSFARIVRYVAHARTIRTVVVNAMWSDRGVGGLTATLRALTAAHKHVFVTDDVPAFSFDPFECKYRQALLEPSDCTTSLAGIREGDARWLPELRAAVRSVHGTRLLPTTRFFCGPASCSMAHDGQLLYRDYNHLNANGSRYLARRMLATYPALAGGAALR